MQGHATTEPFKLTDEQIANCLAFFELADDDFVLLASLRPFVEKHADAIVEAFYAFLSEHRETRKFLRDDATVGHLKVTQKRYLLALFDGRCDRAYVEERLRVGIAHERIGMPMDLYLGAYRKYVELLTEHLALELRDDGRSARSSRSILKLVCFDIALAIDTYMAAGAATIGRHKAAIRELATPVIGVHDRILLLPLIGAVDSRRAEQAIDAVLTRTGTEQAKVVIIDIAGVPVVDTKVAGTFVNLAAMVRLLGAHTVLTGISAEVARTVVRLGIDTSVMHTRSSLEEGIALALDLVGKTILDKPKPSP